VASRLDVSEKRRARELHRAGRSLREIGAELGRGVETIRLIVAREEPPVSWRGWVPGPGRLTLEERVEIGLGLERDETFTEIAETLDRCVSTVSREVSSNGGRAGYRATGGHRRAFERARRPKPRKLAGAKLAGQVEAWLREWWSPDEIARRLRIEFPDDPMMWVSHETIYQALFVQGRGELRRELTRCLRSGRTQRRPQGRVENRGRMPNMVMISDRPAEAADRAVPGHWEGDLIIGKNGKSAVGTLVERSTRYLLLLHLPHDHTAATVEAAMRRAIAKLPGEFFRTITWDQGREMARHATFTIETGIPIYFCDPHSPWQRGSNENTNGLLRQYLPKGTDLSLHSAADLDDIARSLNNRPRKTLDYLKPSERLAELLALTA
jgi:IS30 family transposase